MSVPLPLAAAPPVMISHGALLCEFQAQIDAIGLAANHFEI